ncbi:hypothetical protein F5I97DRAFT_150763 [Phlebopus sp. FC_14]|nr:hypothetical protein F5I97DRAFT_150763 [Phlebopus sp. FC_14]
MSPLSLCPSRIPSSPTVMANTIDVLASHFIGVILCSSLYGITLTQTWFYFHSYPQDRWCMKFLVALLRYASPLVLTVNIGRHQCVVCWEQHKLSSSLHLYINTPSSGPVILSWWPLTLLCKLSHYPPCF